MITVFTTTKPFGGHNGVIQTNAITSWKKVLPGCEIILMGDDPGAGEICEKLGLIHVKEVKCNAQGTPLISDMFEIAQQKAAFDLVCYINADIIFLSDFIAAAARAKREFKKFLMIGRRRDWDLGAERIIDFDDENWEVKLRNEIGEKGKLHPPTGIDYFLFTKGLYEKMPPFAIGRPVWDHFFVYHAGVKGAAVLDATNQVMILHQNHDYSHHSGGFKGVWAGVEAKKNLALAASGKHKHHIEHATHKMTHDKISPRTLQRAYRIIVKDSQIRLARFFVWAKATVLKLIQGK